MDIRTEQTSASTNGFRPIIVSLLDTDLYKFTMQQAMFYKYRGVVGVTEFVCRSTPAFPLSELVEEVNEQLDHLCTLRFTQEELAFLAEKSYFKPDYIDFLEDFQLKRRYVKVFAVGGVLRIRIDGPLVRTTPFEIFVLAIINELYFRRLIETDTLDEGRRRLQEKIQKLRDFGEDLAFDSRNLEHPFEFFDFGTRRRFSREWQEEVVATLAREVPQFFKGTSNVYLAMKHKLPAIGTMAHEWLQMQQGLPVQLRLSQKQALQDWADVYQGELGVALTDVISMDAFLRDFNLYFAKLFDGIRHDSGDPFAWGEKALEHYRKLKINTHTKRLVFSDGLDLDKAFALYRRFASEIMLGFGIGTWLTNDVGLKAINIVHKLVEVNEQPVAKISDAPGKTLCEDKVFLRYLCQVFKVDASFIDGIKG